MNKNLLILGAGGHGRVVKEIALKMGCFERVDFLDDHSDLAIGKCKDVKKFINNYTYAFVAFGNNKQRMKWSRELIGLGYQLPVLIDPIAYVSSSAKIREGTVVCAMAVVNTNVNIEQGCIISIGALIDHDSYVNDYSHINSGAIVKSNCKVEQLMKVDSGMVFSNGRTTLF